MFELFKVAILSVVSLIVLFLLCKLIGKRQIGQLTMFDYVNSITIGSIAAELATNLENWEQPLLALVLYGLLTALIDWSTCKSLILRKFFNGRPSMLYEDGKLYQMNLIKAKLDLGEFLAQCRLAGYFDLNQLQSVLLEPNGQMSFLPKAGERPVTPTDLNLQPQEETPFINVIADGNVLYQNLKAMGKDDIWLEKQLHSQDIGQTSEVFLGVCDRAGTFYAWRRQKEEPNPEIFE